MSYNDSKHIRDIIIQHCENPKHKVDKFSKTDFTIKTKYTNCADNYLINIQILNSKIIETSFYGNGCIVSLSSLDILLDTIKFSTIKSAIKIIKIYLKLIREQNPKIDEKIKDLNCFINIGTKQPNRLICATNACEEILNFLEKMLKND